MLALLAAALVIKSIQPLQSLPIESGLDVPTYGYARDAAFEYLATPKGLYRSPSLAATPAELLAFPGEGVNAVIAAGDLIVAKGGGIEASTSPEHTLVRSADGGRTFTAIDAGLLDCSTPPCGYLVPTRMAFGEGRLYVNAGGNVLATADLGVSWHQLYGLQHQGRPAAQMCPVKFEPGAGGRLFLGGECPLDVAWLHRGTLTPSGLQWAEGPAAVTTPDLENRNVQFIRDLGDGVVFAGIEGALLKSTDGGTTFRFVLHYPIEGADRYPYIGHMVVSSRDPQLMIIGGFDKKDLVGYLAWSADGGETWQDVSHLAGTPYVTLLTEDRGGRILIGFQSSAGFTLAEVVLGERMKRRAVRR